MNATLRVYGPLPHYDLAVKKTKNAMEYYLKGSHFLIINIDIEALKNGSNAVIDFRIITDW